MPNLRLFCGLGITVPLRISWSASLTTIVWLIRIGFVVLAVVPFTRHFAMLGRRLARRMLSALLTLRLRCVTHIGVLRLLRRLLEQTIDTHHRRRHFAIEATVDADQIVRLYVLFVKRGGRNDGSDGAAFIAKLAGEHITAQ